MKKFITVIPVKMVVSAENAEEARGIAEAFANEYLLRQGNAFSKMVTSEKPLYETGVPEVSELGAPAPKEQPA